MGKSVEEVSKIAAEWWADRVINPKFDNGDSGLGGLFGMAMASQLVKPVGAENREKFVNAVSEYICDQLSRQRKPLLDVDYGPCMALANAASASGISGNNFPWKTCMWVDENHVSVRYGYGAKEEFLYSNKEYWRKRIEACKDHIKSYKSGEYLSYINDPDEKRATAEERVKELNTQIMEYKKLLEDSEG